MGGGYGGIVEAYRGTCVRTQIDFYPRASTVAHLAGFRPSESPKMRFPISLQKICHIVTTDKLANMSVAHDIKKLD